MEARIREEQQCDEWPQNDLKNKKIKTRIVMCWVTFQINPKNKEFEGRSGNVLGGLQANPKYKALKEGQQQIGFASGTPKNRVLVVKKKTKNSTS